MFPNGLGSDADPPYRIRRLCDSLAQMAFGKGEGAMEKRFGVVSADGHCRLMHLPFDLWTKRLSRKFQDEGPRVVQGPDGTRQWIVEGRPWSGVGWSGVGRGPVNCYTRAGLAEEPEPGI